MTAPLRISPTTTPAAEQATLERFVGVAEIREAFSTSDRHIRRWVSCGKFPRPALRIGKMLRWRLSDVERFVREHEIK